ncbi:hypothetical protein AB1Y20_012535 [Prymnesium parvum]|uniref:Uncharacterized protein n=1 Tax=Prymnesium parvum TaxID=97485 RepID=A0AB34IJP7_PRYPA
MLLLAASLAPSPRAAPLVMELRRLWLDPGSHRPQQHRRLQRHQRRSHHTAAPPPLPPLPEALSRPVPLLTLAAAAFALFPPAARALQRRRAPRAPRPLPAPLPPAPRSAGEAELRASRALAAFATARRPRLAQLREADELPAARLPAALRLAAAACGGAERGGEWVGRLALAASRRLPLAAAAAERAALAAAAGGARALAAHALDARHEAAAAELVRAEAGEWARAARRAPAAAEAAEWRALLAALRAEPLLAARAAAAIGGWLEARGGEGEGEAMAMATSAAELALVAVDLVVVEEGEAGEGEAALIEMIPTLALTTLARQVRTHELYGAWVRAHALSSAAATAVLPHRLSLSAALRKLLGVLPSRALKDATAAFQAAVGASLKQSQAGLAGEETERLLRLAKSIGLSAQRAEAIMAESEEGFAAFD